MSATCTLGSDATTEQSGPAISDLYPALNLIERAVTDDDTTAIKRELEAFNNLVRDLRARDKEGKYHDRIYRAERQIRSLLDSRVRSARLTEAEKQLYLIYLGGGKLRDADELYRQKLLVQISGNEAAALAILKIVTTAWNTGTLASLERDAKDPPTDVENGGVQLRDAYSLDDLKVDRGIYQRVVRGLHARAAGGAERGQLGVPEVELLRGAAEELGVLGVGARPAALDVAHAQAVELPRDAELVGDREVESLLLRAVAHRERAGGRRGVPLVQSGQEAPRGPVGCSR